MEKNKPLNLEFVGLMAALMSIVALTIDAILPAISQIGISINSYDSASHQLLITMIFLGLGLGQLVFGPFSDSFGRKPTVYVGFSIFVVASIICVVSPSLEWMVVGRILQGIGLSAPRTISISIIRDTYKGDYMAKIMSFVTSVFILVPVVAPALGKFVMDQYHWKGIFYVQLVMAILVGLWFWRRQPETLKPEFKTKFTRYVFVDGIKELIKHKETLGFTMISGFITGAFMVYLSASQHIFQNQYGLIEEFPYIFAGLASGIGASTLLNGTLVMRLGMRRLSFLALIVFTLNALVYSLLFWSTANPSLVILLSFMGVQFATIGFIFGNIRAIAMEPIGHIAGIGAAITGFLATLLAVPIATVIGYYVDKTALPLFIGFTLFGLLSLAIFVKMKAFKKITITS
ncbi:multidrug effflux MFS transporter [Bizionia paragorgiae]|uniref:MFS transporter, DHA1 family, bicyclomycin/chloramphenicol resistance protein n=1 Tax=Bizionia paragorgiae TaxID=283786 RepID=A0A1H3XQS2_BIZPA|nr:multidrug effflux MFS transporter [Bizionia paragorgiae]SEA00868.1 MFS transporter, DHA1 family, bicyclomycin/chloramphenicol resistance protein [Bizionia paragorgiae]